MAALLGALAALLALCWLRALSSAGVAEALVVIDAGAAPTTVVVTVMDGALAIIACVAAIEAARAAVV